MVEKKVHRWAEQTAEVLVGYLAASMAEKSGALKVAPSDAKMVVRKAVAMAALKVALKAERWAGSMAVPMVVTTAVSLVELKADN